MTIHLCWECRAVIDDGWDAHEIWNEDLRRWTWYCVLHCPAPQCQPEDDPA